MRGYQSQVIQEKYSAYLLCLAPTIIPSDKSMRAITFEAPSQIVEVGHRKDKWDPSHISSGRDSANVGSSVSETLSSALGAKETCLAISPSRYAFAVLQLPSS
jgi:hypothetical protein